MKKIEPHVGIFFLVGDRLLLESTPISSAGRYGSHLIHEPGHPEFWEKLNLEGEYDDHPRGRCQCNVHTGEWTLLADACILRRPEVLAEIKERLHLPDGITVGGDEHYRCIRCLNEADKLSTMAEFEIEFRDVPTPAQGGIRQAVNTYDLEVDIIEDNSFVVTRNKGGRYSLTCIKSGNRGNRRVNSGWIDETEPADIAKRMVALAKRN